MLPASSWKHAGWTHALGSFALATGTQVTPPMDAAERSAVFRADGDGPEETLDRLASVTLDMAVSEVDEKHANPTEVGDALRQGEHPIPRSGPDLLGQAIHTVEVHTVGRRRRPPSSLRIDRVRDTEDTIGLRIVECGVLPEGSATHRIVRFPRHVGCRQSDEDGRAHGSGFLFRRSWSGR